MSYLHGRAFKCFAKYVGFLNIRDYEAKIIDRHSKYLVKFLQYNHKLSGAFILRYIDSLCVRANRNSLHEVGLEIRL